MARRVPNTLVSGRYDRHTRGTLEWRGDWKAQVVTDFIYIVLVPAPVDPITHRSKADEVASRLRHMLGTGRYQPGQPLIQGEIAEALGVSTMPVREALLRLSAEGLIISGPNRRFSVASYTPDELRDTFWTYSVLQGELARRAGERGDETLLVEILTKWHQQYVEVIDDENARFTANWEFFKEVNAAARSPQLVKILRSVLRIFPGIMDATPGSPQLAAEWQAELIKAFRGKDADLAAGTSERFAREAGELYIKSRS